MPCCYFISSFYKVTGKVLRKLPKLSHPTRVKKALMHPTLFFYFVNLIYPDGSLIRLFLGVY